MSFSDRSLNVETQNQISMPQIPASQTGQTGISRYSDPLSTKVAHLSDNLIKDFPQFASSNPIKDSYQIQQQVSGQQVALAQQFFHGVPQKQMAMEFVRQIHEKTNALMESRKKKNNFFYVEETELDDQKSEEKLPNFNQDDNASC